MNNTMNARVEAFYGSTRAQRKKAIWKIDEDF